MVTNVVNKLLKKAVKNDAGKVIGYDGYDKMKMVNVGLGGAFSISDYNDMRDNGNGVISSALMAAGNFAVSNMVGMPFYLATTMAPALAQGAVDGFDALASYGRSLDLQAQNKPFSNSTFVDTQQTYTMRQAGLNLARQSKYATQQAMLGDEARMTYR